MLMEFFHHHHHNHTKIEKRNNAIYLHFEWVAIVCCLILQRHVDGSCSNGDCCGKRHAAMPINYEMHRHRSFSMYDCSTNLMFPILATVENYAYGTQKIKNYIAMKKKIMMRNCCSVLTRRQYARMDCHLNSVALNSV